MNLTVIIPAYNEEKYIENTLISLKNCEVIVVCNACTDNTAKIAKKFGATVIETKEKGVSLARNLGAKKAKGSKLVFLDADTYVSPTILNKIANSSFQIGASWVKPNSNKILDQSFMILKSTINTVFKHSSGMVFCDKNIYERVGGFNERVSKREDTFFIREASKHARFGIIPDYVHTSMRRYRQKGFFPMLIFWSKETLFPSKKEYESIR